MTSHHANTRLVPAGRGTGSLTSTPRQVNPPVALADLTNGMRPVATPTTTVAALSQAT